MQRREFIKLNGGLFLTLPFAPGVINPFASNIESMDYDTHKCKIGKYTCRIFKDMMFKYLGKDYFINASAEQVTQELDRYQHKADNIPSPFIALLLEYGKEKILIDTGIGFSTNPIIFRGNSYKLQGRLIEILQKENINKNEITHVILTHFHPDHIGGVYDEHGKMNFPNAKYTLHEDEWNYWFSSKADNQPPMFGYFIEKNISGLKNQNIELIKGEEQQILPGIRAIQTPGHTPGQLALTIASEKDKLLFISDAFLHPLHIEHIDWQTNYDLDHELAKASRKKLLELAYKENMQINAFHFEFPGLGYVDKVGNNWKWIYSKK
jgi:glyoxylase-like metal-dependent hydrolase (beta-lactamase superfamily II)